MTTRCKFKCEEKTEQVNGYKICFKPVTHGSPENESFFKWTPYGSMEIGLISAYTADMFNVGEDYYFDISSAKPVADPDSVF